MGFNRSLRIESRVVKLTGDPGAVLLREIVEQNGTVGWMTSRLTDPRSQVDVTHDLALLIRMGVLLGFGGAGRDLLLDGRDLRLGLRDGGFLILQR